MISVIVGKIRQNYIFVLLGAIYWFFFSGITVGDYYFRALENGYPLFGKNVIDPWPIWLGFDIPHLLSIPLLRSFQILLGLASFKPSALELVQFVNLALAVITLKLFHMTLVKMEIKPSMAMMCTFFLGLSYSFSSNINAEMHHFGIFLLMLLVYFLADIERRNNAGKGFVFLFSLSLFLVPLFHLENIIYCFFIFAYIVIRPKIRGLFLLYSRLVVFAILIAAFLTGVGFLFHYIELNALSWSDYLSKTTIFARFIGDADQLTLSVINFNFINFYGIIRTYLESISITSRMMALLPAFLSISPELNMWWLLVSIIVVVFHTGLFVAVNFMLAYFVVKAWIKEQPLVKLLLLIALFYLFLTALMLRGIYLLPEFYIFAVVITAILYGYYFNNKGKIFVYILFAFVLLTVLANLLFYFMPQKISSDNLNNIFKNILISRDDGADMSIFQVSLFSLPYQLGKSANIRIYSAEHVFDSHGSMEKQLAIISNNYDRERKVFFIGPKFMFDPERNISREDAMFINLGKDPEKLDNVKLFLNEVRDRFVLKESAGSYFYNFGGLGQLLPIGVFELVGGK